MLRFAALVAGLAAWGALAGPLELTLSAAVARALEANRPLAAARLGRDDEALALSAAQSEFDWKIVSASSVGRIGNNALSPETSGINGSIGAQLFKRFDSGTTVSVGPSYNRTGSASNTTLNASLQQPLSAALGSDVVLADVHRAAFNLQSSERILLQSRTRIALEVVAAYHEATRQDRVLAASEALVDRLRRHEVVAAAKERSGLAGPSDTLRAQIRLKDIEDTAHQARTSLAQAHGRLRGTLALPASVDLRLIEPELASWDGTNGLVLALEHAPELRQIRAEIEDARRAARVAAAATRPEVTLNVSYGHGTLVDPVLQSFLPATQKQWAVYVQAAGDLARTAEKLQHRRTLLRIEQLELALGDKEEEIRRRYRDQEQALHAAAARAAVRQQQSARAREKLSLAQVKFAHDMADNFELVEAEGDLLRAEAEFAAAIGDRAVATYSLRAMIGTFP